MDPATAALIIEVAKISLNAYFNFMKHAGQTEEEINRIYIESKKEFDQNNPGNLPDPS